MRAHARILIYAYAHAHIHAHAQAHAHAHKHKCLHNCTRTRARTSAHSAHASTRTLTTRCHLSKKNPPKIHTSTIIKKYEHEPLKARGTEPHEKSQSLARAPLPAVRFAVAGRATRLSLWSKCQRMCTWKLFILLLSVSN